MNLYDNIRLYQTYPKFSLSPSLHSLQGQSHCVCRAPRCVLMATWRKMALVHLQRDQKDRGHPGPASGSECFKVDDWYSQCRPKVWTSLDTKV